MLSFFFLLFLRASYCVEGVAAAASSVKTASLSHATGPGNIGQPVHYTANFPLAESRRNANKGQVTPFSLLLL